MNEKTPEYLQGNVDSWQKEAENYVERAEQAWASDEPFWGIWGIPESETKLLPEDMAGMRAIELGCGTAYVSAWMRRRGADVVAIDPTPNQLQTARHMQQKYELDFTIQQGFAESVPYPDQHFDFAISEYGAALWADPYAWIPEASRLLKPGGQLVFLSNSPLSVMCMNDYESDGPMGPELLRPYFDMHKTVWPDTPDETEFHLTHGDWIALFRSHGLSIERLLELRVPEGTETEFAWVDAQWASRWPSEEVWTVQKDPA